MNAVDDFEVKDNDFLRQFEARVDDQLIKLEYTEQPRKIFLTKFVITDQLKAQGYGEKFLEAVFDRFLEKQYRVMPTCPEVTRFFKSHKRKYKKLLPVGINI